MREETVLSVVEAGEIGEMVVLAIPDAIVLFTPSMLWIQSVEIGEGVLQGRQAFAVCEVGFWE